MPAFLLSPLLRWAIVLAIIIGGFLYIKSLRAENALAGQRAAQAEAINAANVKAMHELQVEKAFAEAILSDRVARKSREADQLGKLVKHVLSIDARAECPVGHSIDAALDGLPDTAARPGQN